MAFKNAKNMAELLQCSICMEEFEGSGAMKPKMLPCQHSFCMTCLVSMSSGRRIECPLCRAVHQKSVDELPNNLILLQLVDSARPPIPQPRKLSLRSVSVTPLEPEPQTPVVIIRTHYKTPTKVLQALKSYLLDQDTENFDDEELSTILQCLEHYIQPSLQHYDIIIACVKILEGRSSFFKALSNNMQDRLQKDTMAAMKLCRSRSEIRSPCIKVLCSLIDSECAKNYTVESIDVLFGFLDGVIKMQHEQLMLVYVLGVCFCAMSVEEKERIGNRHNVKLLLHLAQSNWTEDQCISRTLCALTNLTDMASTPCRSIVMEGGLDLLNEILKDENRSTEVTLIAVILLCNISEVQDIKRDIIKKKDLIETLVPLMKSKDPSGKYVSVWIKKDPGPVSSFKRSLTPLFIMLKTYETPPCQLFAAWLLRNLCTHDSARMQELVIAENGLPLLLDIKDNVYADKKLRKVVGDILACISSVQ